MGRREKSEPGEVKGKEEVPRLSSEGGTEAARKKKEQKKRKDKKE